MIDSDTLLASSGSDILTLQPIGQTPVREPDNDDSRFGRNPIPKKSFLQLDARSAFRDAQLYCLRHHNIKVICTIPAYRRAMGE